MSGRYILLTPAETLRAPCSAVRHIAFVNTPGLGEDYTMATKRPSFLKRQKELKRMGRALEKREARRERREARKGQAEQAAVPQFESGK